MALVCLVAALAALDAGAARRDAGRGAVRRGLGGDPGLPAGASAAAISSSPRSCSTTSPSALLIYLLVNVLRPPGQMDPASARFPEGANLPTLNEIPGLIADLHQGGARQRHALHRADRLRGWSGCCCGARGLATRSAPSASRNRLRAMPGSTRRQDHHDRDADLGRAGRPDGDQQRDGRGASGLLQNSAEGAGFIGIAVALMGRNHPFGRGAGGDPVRLPLPGRGGTWPVDHDPDRAAHRGAGSGDPVHRGAGR